MVHEKCVYCYQKKTFLSKHDSILAGSQSDRLLAHIQGLFACIIN